MRVAAWLSSPLQHSSVERLSRLLAGRRADLDLEVLDQRVGEQLLAHGLELIGVFDVELDQAPDVDVGHSVESQRGQGALDGLALGIEDAGLGADEDPSPHGFVRSSQASNGSSQSRS